MHSAKQTAVVHLLLLFLLNISNCGGGFEMIEQEEVQHADVHFLGAKKKALNGSGVLERCCVGNLLIGNVQCADVSSHLIRSSG